MKKSYLRILTIIFLSMVSISIVSCSDEDQNEVETTITVNDLPSAAKDFLNKYFRDYEISKIIMNEEDNLTLYEVNLAEGYQIIFNSSGNWTQVDAPYGKTIPTGFIPEPILQTLNYQYNGYGITEINTVGENYHIVLSNNQGGDSIELEFNQSGEITSTSQQ